MWIGVEEERRMWEVCDYTFDELDILHGMNWFGFEYLSKSKRRTLKVTHTHHGGLNQWWFRSKPPFKLNFIGISKWMKKVYESQGMPSRYCYNGIDLDKYPYQEEKGDRLMFLGRMSKIKAPHIAIEVAEKSDEFIDIVGGTSFVDDPNYVEEIKTKCVDYRGSMATFIGEVSHQDKLRYLQNAKALLIPSRFGEPFGLIAVEAMACGTIPIALNDEALSEIIEDGKSGFICNDIAEMVLKVSEIDTIDTRNVRERAEMFSKEVMSKRYIELYKDILEGREW